MGGALGLVGKSFEVAGFQQYLTIFAGIALMMMAFASFGGRDFASKIPVLSKFLLNVKINLGKLLQKSDLQSRFATGILNGFLPCGMVYMALTASLAAGGIWQGALFMAVFGLGTFPFMFVVVLAGNLISSTFRRKVLKAVPVMMLLLGGLFILRGLELGIPYLSPKENALHVKHNDSELHQDGDHSTCH